MRQTKSNIVHDLRAICSLEHVTLSAFAVDSDTPYDPMHLDQDWSNRFVFQSLGTMPTIWKFHILCDPLHLLKRVRDRWTKATLIIIGLSKDLHEPNFSALKELFGSNLPGVMFSDAQLTKMYDSLPMVFFHFRYLMSLMAASVHDPGSEEKYLPWLCFCLPWVLFNKVLSHRDVNTRMRLMWFKRAYLYMMTCQDTSKRTGFGQNVKRHKNTEHNGTKRTLFDRKLIWHGTDTITILVYEIEYLPVGETLSL
jgi:hypothetical protein